jgi:hypothetical protein
MLLSNLRGAMTKKTVGKKTAGKSGAERIKKWRNKQSGKKQINIYLDQEDVGRLDTFKNLFNESIAQVIKRALMALEEDIQSSDGEMASADSPAEEDLPTYEEITATTMDYFKEQFNRQ